jgi:hypothetical protein
MSIKLSLGKLKSVSLSITNMIRDLSPFMDDESNEVCSSAESSIHYLERSLSRIDNLIKLLEEKQNG